MPVTASSSALNQALVEQGVCQLSPFYSNDVIRKWNAAVDLYLQPNTPHHRHYLRADELLQLGILDSLLSNTLVSCVSALMPNASLYHLHLYETPPANTPHIHGDNGLSGWHRDDDCLYAWEESHLHYFSLFIYLTNVGENDGAFEIAPRHAGQRLKSKEDCYRIIGAAGTTFMFNRTHWHRATANLSASNRRVIKLSFQNNYLYNDRIQLPEFDSLRQNPIGSKAGIASWLAIGEEPYVQQAQHS